MQKKGFKTWNLEIWCSFPFVFVLFFLGESFWYALNVLHFQMNSCFSPYYTHSIVQISIGIKYQQEKVWSSLRRHCHSLTLPGCILPFHCRKTKKKLFHSLYNSSYRYRLSEGPGPDQVNHDLDLIYQIAGHEFF